MEWLDFKRTKVIPYPFKHLLALFYESLTRMVCFVVQQIHQARYLQLASMFDSFNLFLVIDEPLRKRLNFLRFTFIQAVQLSQSFPLLLQIPEI